MKDKENQKIVRNLIIGTMLLGISAVSTLKVLFTIKQPLNGSYWGLIGVLIAIISNIALIYTIKKSNSLKKLKLMKEMNIST